MTFQPAPNCAQFNMRYLYQGQPVENVYACQKFTPAPFTLADLQAVSLVFADWEHATALPMRNAGITYNGCLAVGLDSDTSPEYFQPAHIGETGGVAGVPLPNNVTIAVKWTTGTRGRSFRGRTFWLGLETDQISANQLLPTPATNILATYNTLMADLIGASPSAEIVVLSRYHAKAKRTSAIGTPVLAPAFSDNILDSQRRRLPAHNRHRR